MSTNYYIKETSLIGKEFDNITHIGLYACGWFFQLHIIPEKGINNLDDWKRVFNIVKNNPASLKIIDEYNNEITVESMLSIIENPIDLSNLKYSPIDSRCKGHFDGPYDYIIGEFC